MSNFQPVKVFDPANSSDFLIANTQEEQIRHIVSFASRQITPAYEPYFNYNSVFANQFFDSLRPHQKASLVNSTSCDIGQFILPTSTGKTRAGISILLKDALEKHNLKKSGVYLIGNHRLTLSEQLIDETIKTFKNCGLLFDVLLVNSDKNDNSDFQLPIDKFEVLNTTTEDDIKRFHRISRKNNKHLLIVSTYHSVNRLKDLYIDIAVFDEAHELTKDKFSENLKDVTNIQRKYFFTATRKTINVTNGMGNEFLFGKVLYSFPPKEAIDLGEMCSPKLHIVKCDNETANSDNMSIKTTIDAFLVHQSNVSRLSSSPGKLGAKMLISTCGTQQMYDIHNNNEFQTFCKENDINVFTFSSSDDFGYYHNFRKTTRKNVYGELKILKDSEKAIILHYDILSEGIDVPGITGVAIYRQMSLSKMLQTIGRCLRLHPDDRSNIYSKQMLPSETDKFIKPFGWVILPEYFNIKFDEMEELILELYNEYNLKDEDIFEDNSPLGMKTLLVQTVTEDDVSETTAKDYSTTHIIKSVQDKMIRDWISQFSISDLLLM